MSAPVNARDSRFVLEARDHALNTTAVLPYRNLQGEFMMGASGQQLRGEIPFRNYPQVTQANLYPGKHELWLFDQEYSTQDPIFGGPLWSLTGGSDDGVLSFAAQDPLSYLAKRVLRNFKSYSSVGIADIVNDLIVNMNAQYATTMSCAGSGGSTTTQVYLSTSRFVFTDLIESLSQIGSGFDYFFTPHGNVNGGGYHDLEIWPGGKVGTAIGTLEYGTANSTLDGYSVQWNAQTIANRVEIAGANGLISATDDTTKRAEYAQLYNIVESSDATVSATLTAQSAKRIKDTKSAKVIPSLVTKKLTPLIDFSFGSTFTVNIKDEYTIVSQDIRTIGWQLTIGAGDKTTTVIYTKDTEGVT